MELMSRTNWIILALALMAPGTIGLGWGHLQKRASERRIAEARRAVADAPSADEYLQMYHEWSQLPAAEKSENQWGYGKYGGPDIQKRLRQDQVLRLEADLPDLDAGVRSYPPQLAEVLYGIRWPDRLAEYQRQRETRGIVMTASVILLFAGGLWLLGGGVKHYVSRYFSDEDDEVEQESQDEQRLCFERPRRKPQQQGQETVGVGRQTTSLRMPMIYSMNPPTQISSPHTVQLFRIGMGPQKRPDYRKPAPDYVRLRRRSGEEPLFQYSMCPTADEKLYFGRWTRTGRCSGRDADDHASCRQRLTELTEEVGDSRLAAQQDQMRKLQDGYDWMIIRRFCMRIIRCIDNVDDRMARLDTCEQCAAKLSGGYSG